MFGFTRIAAFAALASLVAAADPCPGQTDVIQNCKNSGQVALTFDDGPYLWERDIVSDMGGSKATFFLNGDNYGCIYDHADVMLDLYHGGHTLGSHTWSHADITTLSRDQLHAELEKVEQAFIKILGVKPLYFRPPYGNYNQQSLEVLAERGYKKLFMWTDDTEDANGASVSFSKQVMDQVVSKYPEPRMVLSHSTISTTSSEVMKYAVPKLKAAGYNLVAVDTCLGSDGEWPYVWVGNPGTRDSSWKC